ncbi:MAG: ADP-glyceromanno-heptose 6-epimerase [Elusimicrobia bacterium GWA2_64_40]|nr:MAG: ADP-glyceromanno-heptose 6-epimerase [Elusimicrobia bacterium GWA2_64_40]OGR67692.1 MAG: ADP-glyceromanno-heptose 6-epimerase [Elusimicrobia bacterium GWB2_63_16]HAN05613.1 ADP-glyceromanno-heptose 6-epimerase [Elusimicrobiota bacterium]
MKKYLVTGGAGFIGSNIAFALEGERKARVAVLDNFSSGNYKNLLGFGGDVIADDILSRAWFARAGKVDAVFHQAAVVDTTEADQRKMMAANVDGFRNVLEYALEYGVKRVIYASSAAVYGNSPCPMHEDQTPTPENVYGFSKAIMDNVAREFAAEHKDMTIVGLRYFNVYGPREYYKGKMASMVFQLYNQLKAGKRPRIFKFGEQMRDFVYVKDLVRGNLNALDAKKSCVCNLATGKPGNFNEVIEALNKALKTDLAPEYFDNPYGFYQNKTQADLRQAKALLNYRPEWSLADGIADYVKILEKTRI